jgi:hypothetical protein
MMEHKMVKVSVEVRSGTARFQVGVRARSIREALGLVGGKYPHSEVRVVFPIEPEGYFVDGSAQAAMVGSGQEHKAAA